MTTISGHGLAAELPVGWSGEIYNRPSPAPAPGAAPRTTAAAPVLHAASFALPAQRGDFGGGAVELMTPVDAFCTLFEYDRASAGQALFSAAAPARLTASDFHVRTLQRALAQQVGCQRFFSRAGRAFCLYVVLGSARAAPALLPPVNALLGSIRVD